MTSISAFLSKVKDTSCLLARIRILMTLLSRERSGRMRPPSQASPKLKLHSCWPAWTATLHVFIFIIIIIIIIIIINLPAWCSSTDSVYILCWILCFSSIRWGVIFQRTFSGSHRFLEPQGLASNLSALRNFEIKVIDGRIDGYTMIPWYHDTITAYKSYYVHNCCTTYISLIPLVTGSEKSSAVESWTSR